MNYTQINFEILHSTSGLKSIKSLRSNNLLVISSGRYISYLKDLINNSKNIYNFLIIDYNYNSEPTFEIIQDVLKKISFVPDKIIAVGGGSIMDTAKAVKALFNEKSSYEIGKRKNVIVNSEILKCELIAVPSVLGSGSEVSSSSIILSNEKNYLASIELIPNKIIYDLSLYSTLSNNQKIFGLGDSIVHMVESLFSSLNKGILSIHLKSVLNSSFDYLKKLDGNIDDLNNLILFSYWGGIFQDKFLVGPSHCIAHNLTNLNLKKSHAECVSFLFPKVFELIYKNNKNKLLIDNSLDFNFLEFLYLFEEKITTNSNIKSLKCSSLDNVRKDPAGRFFKLNLDYVYEKFI